MVERYVGLILDVIRLKISWFKAGISWTAMARAVPVSTGPSRSRTRTSSWSMICPGCWVWRSVLFYFLQSLNLSNRFFPQKVRRTLLTQTSRTPAPTPTAANFSSRLSAPPFSTTRYPHCFLPKFSPLLFHPSFPPSLSFPPNKNFLKILKTKKNTYVYIARNFRQSDRRNGRRAQSRTHAHAGREARFGRRCCYVWWDVMENYQGMIC